jgi:cellulose synthase/poly-beta-1,6-N-acetylglucosamine synthase-like glycosyltransferase
LAGVPQIAQRDEPNVTTTQLSPPTRHAVGRVGRDSRRDRRTGHKAGTTPRPAISPQPAAGGPVWSPPVANPAIARFDVGVRPPVTPVPHAARPPVPFVWWIPQLAAFGVVVCCFGFIATRDAGEAWLEVGTAEWWVLTTALHLPLVVILPFLVGGLVERIGYFWRGRAPERAGPLPAVNPTVCVQLPMFNEHAVARRVIEAAAAMVWPADRITVQVLDDSTDADTRALVREVCANVRATTGVHCEMRHRVDRRGYKAGALEEGRRATDAEFLVIFDSDFVPRRDFLLKILPHFFLPNGEPDTGLALVQAQWGHLNHDESALTRAQSLWVDDHHTLQMSWRSARWQFVNFTGTAGVWRASAVEAAGGWRAASLVEDCELSFRHLFAGYRTKFVKEIVAPAELPATYTAYKAQQRRWTQGWVQLQRVHLATLLFRHRCSAVKRLHLLYHMCISWQWAAWAVWITLLPFLIYTDHWFGTFGAWAGVGLYLVPSALWVTVAATLATIETRHSYPGDVTARSVIGRLRRVVPYLIINTGMLPHQFSAFAEGLFAPLHSEFERTPKAASVTSNGDPEVVTPAIAPTVNKKYSVRVHWPYVLTEAAFVVLQLAWTVLFLVNGLMWCAVVSGYMAACVLGLVFRYGDHAGKVCFVVDQARLRLPRRRFRVDPPRSGRAVVRELVARS